MSEPNLALQNLPVFSDNQTNVKISMCSVMGNSISMIEILLFTDISCSEYSWVLSDFYQIPQIITKASIICK